MPKIVFVNYCIWIDFHRKTLYSWEGSLCTFYLLSLRNDAPDTLGLIWLLLTSYNVF